MTRNKIILQKGFDSKGRSWEEVDKIVKKMRQPDYHQKSRGLVWNATPTDKAKYEIQQNILRYKRENNISDQDLKKTLGIKEKRRLECLLFAHIGNFSLDELLEYASKLLGSFELKIVRPGEEIHVVSQPKSNGRTRKHA